MTRRLGGTAIVLVLAAFAATPSHAAFPGQNGRLAFQELLGAGFEQELRLVNPDGTANASLAPAAPSDTEPAWSPDGTKIVFSRFVGAPTFDREIWVINADGTGADQITSGEEDQRPAFSGDGTRITFQRFVATDTEIMVVNADGSGAVTPLTTNTEFDFSPVFSPDSTRIAFDRESAVDGNEIWVMNADGSGQAARTPIDGTWVAEEPDWSPDGTRLAFHRCDASDNECTGPDEIVTIPADVPVVPGTETVVSTPDTGIPEADSAPVYSPDGTRIAFHRTDFAAQEDNLHTVPVAGGAQPQITTANTDTNPDWQPIVPSPSSGTEGNQKNPKKCRGVAVTIRATNGNDVIKGTPGRDVVHGQRGRDVIKGFRGNDRLCGGRDTDRIYGGPGDDILFGGDHPDFLFGEAGIDRIFGGTPKAPIHLHVDTCAGGGGKDFFQNCQKGD